MAGTIYSGTYVTGIVLSDPTTQRPATVTGSVSNQNGDAIYGKPIARWTVANSGTIENTGSTGYGIDLAARGTVENGVSGATSALISGYGGILIRGKLATVSNLGTIEGTGSKRDGVELKAGGQVTNGSTAVTAAQISGGGYAVAIRYDAGTVANFGTLTSSGTYYVVDLFDGGSVSNGSSTSTKALISGSGTGVDVNGATGTVTNFGTIAANLGTLTDPSLSRHYGVLLQAGGSVINGSTDSTNALISGVGIYQEYYQVLGSGMVYSYPRYVTGAIAIRGNPGTVTNFGTISSDRSGVELYAGGTVTNGSAVSTKALIRGHYSGIKIITYGGAVTNFGTIVGYYSFGVTLEAGGSVTNGSSTSTAALINGTGVNIYGATGAVTNFGTIEGGSGVALSAGGRVINGSAASTRALISSGVDISGGAGTVTNFGTIEGGSGVALSAGGRVINGSAASTGALISGITVGFVGVDIFGGAGTVTNFGTIDGGGGRGFGVEVGDARGTVTNFGAVNGAVYLASGGRVINGSTASTGALISGGAGASGGAGTVTNFGTIDGGDVSLTNGGKITNGSAASTRALISGGLDVTGGAGTVTNFGRIRSGEFSVGGEFRYGAALAAGGAVTNLGTISSDRIGVELASGGRIVNGSTASGGALISGAIEGVYISGGAGTVTNFGTISGSSGVAVRIAAGDLGRLVVEPGAMFVDSVLGGGVSTIDFETAGVADMRDVSGFDRITLGNGKSHSLTLTDANFAAVVRTVITVDDGDSGNTVTAVSLPAADRITVRAGDGLDTLTGGAGNDVFFAGGDTMMNGKAGKNEFIFSAPGGNTVGDFAVSATNEVVFSDKGFSLGLSGASGALPAGLFVENSDGHFTGTSQNFAYATGTGDLFYSASGSSGTPALVSHFTGAPSLAASQLFFIT